MKAINSHSIITLGEVSEIVPTSQISKHRFYNDVNSGISVESFAKKSQAQDYLNEMANYDGSDDSEFVNNSGPYYAD